MVRRNADAPRRGPPDRFACHVLDQHRRRRGRRRRLPRETEAGFSRTRIRDAAVLQRLDREPTLTPDCPQHRTDTPPKPHMRPGRSPLSLITPGRHDAQNSGDDNPVTADALIPGSPLRMGGGVIEDRRGQRRFEIIETVCTKTRWRDLDREGRAPTLLSPPTTHGIDAVVIALYRSGRGIKREADITHAENQHRRHIYR